MNDGRSGEEHLAVPDTSPVSELLILWHQLREQGRLVPAEQLCGDCPSMAEELTRRIEALVAMESFLGQPTAKEESDSVSDADRADAASRGTTSSLLAPGYQILRELGRGGMGMVVPLIGTFLMHARPPRWPAKDRFGCQKGRGNECCSRTPSAPGG